MFFLLGSTPSFFAFFILFLFLSLSLPPSVRGTYRSTHYPFVPLFFMQLKKQKKRQHSSKERKTFTVSKKQSPRFSSLSLSMLLFSYRISIQVPFGTTLSERQVFLRKRRIQDLRFRPHEPRSGFHWSDRRYRSKQAELWRVGE